MKPDPWDSQTCKDCRLWTRTYTLFGNEDYVGVCHYDPPRPFMFREKTGEDDWCSHWVALDGEGEDDG